MAPMPETVVRMSNSLTPNLVSQTDFVCFWSVHALRHGSHDKSGAGTRAGIPGKHGFDEQTYTTNGPALN